MNSTCSSVKPASNKLFSTVSIHRRERSGGLIHGALGGRVATRGNAWGWARAYRRTPGEVVEVGLPSGVADRLLDVGVIVQFADDVVHDRVEEVFAAVHVAVQSHRLYVQAAGNGAHGGCGDALLIDEGDRFGNDLVCT